MEKLTPEQTVAWNELIKAINNLIDSGIERKDLSYELKRLAKVVYETENKWRKC